MQKAPAIGRPDLPRTEKSTVAEKDQPPLGPEAAQAGQRPIAAAAVLQRLNVAGMPVGASLATLSRPGPTADP